MLEEPANLFFSTDSNKLQPKALKPIVANLVIPQSRQYQPSTTSSGNNKIIGDGGAQWRISKVKRVLQTARDEHKSIAEVARDRFASAEEFNSAVEEMERLENRQSHSKIKVSPVDATSTQQERTYSVKMPPTVLQTADDPQLRPIEVPKEPVDLNRLQAHINRARLRGDTLVQRTLEKEYEYESAMSNTNTSKFDEPTTILPKFDSRGKAIDIGTTSKTDYKRKHIHDPDDVKDKTPYDLLREERMSRGTSDQDAKRIMKDGKYENSNDYQEDNADKLAQSAQSSDSQKRQKAINDYKKHSHVQDSCPFCITDGRQPEVPVIATSRHMYLALPKTVPLVPGHCLIVPLEHLETTVDCEDDEWVEIRNFMKTIMRMFHQQNKSIIFMETAMEFRKSWHTVIECIPVPHHVLDEAPIFFKHAILNAAEEWSTHVKLKDSSKRGFVRTFIPELPYFHVWFGLDKGVGHVIENEGKFPFYFGKEVLAGIMDISADKWRRPRQLTRDEREKFTRDFKVKYQPFDWSRLYSIQ